MELREFDLESEKLILDPNNYRFHDLRNYRRVAQRTRFAEEAVQANAQNLLETTDKFELDSLKDSLSSNGFVRLERIVVEYFDGDADNSRYLVIEGNRRLAAIRSLLREHQVGGLDLSDHVLLSLQLIPVIQVIGTLQELETFRRKVMAIRHVAGIQSWGSYQQAKLIVELYEQGDRQFGSVAKQIGIRPREAGRRYRASKALQQMEEDDEYGQFARPELYGVFHEIVAARNVRDWLGWNDNIYRAENEGTRKALYELLSPREVNGKSSSPKLGDDIRRIRKLKDIVDKPYALHILLDADRPFEDAEKAVEEETLHDVSDILEASLSSVLRSLRQPPTEAWFQPSEQAKRMWNDLLVFIDHIKPFMEHS